MNDTTITTSTTGGGTVFLPPGTFVTTAEPSMPHIPWYDTTIFQIVLLVFVFLILFWMWLGPHYKVWKAHMDGKADLARAQNEQQIQVAEAQGRLTAAEANKKAAIIEAEAVCAQIEIIGENVKNHPLYLTWQWIEMMKHREGATIYVPTEANLPVLEAGRLIGQKSEKEEKS